MVHNWETLFLVRTILLCWKFYYCLYCYFLDKTYNYRHKQYISGFHEDCTVPWQAVVDCEVVNGNHTICFNNSFQLKTVCCCKLGRNTTYYLLSRFKSVLSSLFCDMWDSIMIHPEICQKGEKKPCKVTSFLIELLSFNSTPLQSTYPCKIHHLQIAITLQSMMQLKICVGFKT